MWYNTLLIVCWSLFMAFGIDDALMLATSSISLTDTIVKTAMSYKGEEVSADLEHLLHEVKKTVLEEIDKADIALIRFEFLLKDSGVDLFSPLSVAIEKTPWWKPWQQHKLSQIEKSFRAFTDSVYGATDDVAALVRCQNVESTMGASVVESTARKRQLHSDIINAGSIGSAISRLRQELDDQKHLLTSQ
jgi:hypothetical protein